MKSLQLLKKYLTRYQIIDYHKITDEQLTEITTNIGLYFFKNINSETVDYVGTAIGKKGLKQRIRNQHLNPNYVQSVFRKKIAKKKQKNLKEESTNFIKRNYKLGILPISEHVSIIKALEQILIFENKSKYNSEAVS